MFLGSYRSSFSGKNRLILPKKLREEIGDKEVVLTLGFESCIFGFEKKSWERQAQKHLEISISDLRGRIVRRVLFPEACLVELDNQGRFVIPKELLAKREIGDDVIIVGAGDHFEIWNFCLWQKEEERLK